MSETTIPTDPQLKPASRRMIVTPLPGFPRPDHLGLHEVPGPLGLLLFQRVRDVQLWAEVPDQRAGLFRAPIRTTVEWAAHAALAEAQVSDPISVLGRLVLFPERATAQEVSAACTKISEWAEERGYLATALDFAEASALASPHDGGLSIRCGRLSRRLALSYRGSQWFLRAVGQARRSDDPQVYIQGHLGYGILLFNLGHYAKARPHFIRAARTAAAKKLWRQAAEAYHDLLGLSTDAGSLDEGDDYARRALHHYPIRNPRIPHLVYDYAYALAKRGHYAAARPLLAAVLPYFVRPQYKMLCHAVFARTCAALGYRDSYDACVGTVLDISAEIQENASASLMHAAAAARTAGDWDLAERISANALDLAIRRAEAGVQEALLFLLDEIALRQGRDRDHPPPDPDRVEATARLLLARLYKQRAPT